MRAVLPAKAESMYIEGDGKEQACTCMSAWLLECIRYSTNCNDFAPAIRINDESHGPASASPLGTRTLKHNRQLCELLLTSSPEMADCY